MKYILFSLSLISCSFLFSQVKIGDNPNSIDASAILEIESTDKGLLMPRLTTLQRDAVASPATGLMLFNTDLGCLQIYNGAFWTECISEPPYRASCLDWFNNGATTSGIYKVDSDGAGGNPPYDCYCDQVNNGGGWTLVFNHNTAGGYWLSQGEADFYNLGSPGLGTNKYSILNKIDELKSGPKYEFKIFYPEFNLTNHWKQSFDPRSGGSPIRPVAGYQAISIGSTANLWGGLERHGGSNTFLDGSVNHPNWYYSIGSRVAWGGGIPPHTSPATDRVQLFIR